MSDREFKRKLKNNGENMGCPLLNECKKPDNFTRLSVQTVYNRLRIFCKHNGIYMGVDETHPSPSVYRYVFYSDVPFKPSGMMVSIDYEEVEDLNKSIDHILDALREHYTL